MGCSQRLKDLSLDDFFLVREGWIPATLSSLFETLGPMLNNNDVIKFSNLS